jgi:hypothetical protein
VYGSSGRGAWAYDRITVWIAPMKRADGVDPSALLVFVCGLEVFDDMTDTVVVFQRNQCA